METKDITLEFYYKKAIYISPVTKSEVHIEIKKVLSFNGGDPIIFSTNGIGYYKSELTSFTI